MTDHPIPFSPPMVHALIKGRKTQTRRIINPQPLWPDAVEKAICFGGAERKQWAYAFHGMAERQVFKLSYAVGNRLWVREAWRTWSDDDGLSGKQIVEIWNETAEGPDDRPNIEYLADHTILPAPKYEWKPGRYRHGRFMPRAFSRTSLLVTGVRVERLQDISEADAIAEGLHALTKDGKLIKYGIPDRDGMPGNDDLGWHWSEWDADPRKAYATLWDSINGEGAWDKNPWVAAYTFTVAHTNIDRPAAP